MRYLILIATILFALSSAIHAEETKILSLEKIESTTDDSTATVTMQFNGELSNRSFAIEEQDGFFQVSLPNILVPENNKFYDGSGPYLKKIAAYQTSPDSAVARIYVRPFDLSKETKANLKTNLNENKATVQLPLSMFKKDITPNSTPAASANPPTLLGEHDLDFYMQRLGIFSLLFFAAIFLVLSLKRLQKNKIFKASGDGAFKMKTLSQLSFSPRQKICLIQVGSEQFLVAVTADQITLLSRIGSTEAKPMMATETESREIRRPIPPTPRSDKFLDSLRSSMNRQEPSVESKIEDFQRKPNIESERKSINYAISDDGIQDKTKESTRAIDDITRLIREKLKSLPQI